MRDSEFLFHHRDRARLAGGWLLLAFLAMGISALFAFLLVMLRTPFINPGWIDARFFTHALVLHVDFAVIIWFLSFAGVLWSLTSRSRWGQAGWLALLFAFAGVGMMLAAAFGTQSEAMLSNYIPVLKTPLFFLGVGSFGIGMIVFVLSAFGTGNNSISSFGVHCAGLALLVALLILLWSGLSPALDSASPHYFEDLFWGLGHVLQFSYMLLMLVAWLQLARLAGIRLPEDRWLRLGFMLAVIPLVAVLFIQSQLTPGSEAYRLAYTELMRYGSWPVALLLGVMLLIKFRLSPAGHHSWAGLALFFSIVLFAVGLFAGTLIRADNVLVTAHYHGTVGAVTLSFMGLSYYLLPKLGANTLAVRSMRIQVGMYGSGMLLLIAGLFWSGLHDVPRKTPGTEHLSNNIVGNGAEIFGMLLMGLGGLIGLSATVMFLFLAARALWPVQQTLFQHRADQPGSL